MNKHIKQITLVAIFLISLLLFSNFSIYVIKNFGIPKLLLEMGFSKDCIKNLLPAFVIVFSNFAAALLTVIFNVKFVKNKKEEFSIKKL